jgi:hypothetical protein
MCSGSIYTIWIILQSIRKHSVSFSLRGTCHLGCPGCTRLPGLRFSKPHAASIGHKLSSKVTQVGTSECSTGVQPPHNERDSAYIHFHLEGAVGNPAFLLNSPNRLALFFVIRGTCHHIVAFDTAFRYSTWSERHALSRAGVVLD